MNRTNILYSIHQFILFIRQASQSAKKRCMFVIAMQFYHFFSLFIFFSNISNLILFMFFCMGHYLLEHLNMNDGGGGGGTISSSMCFVYVFVFVNSDELFFWLEKIFILNTSQSLVAFCYWNLLQFIPSSPSPFPSFFFFQNNKSSSSSHQVKKNF